MSTISAPMHGCVSFESLSGPLTWFIHDAEGQRHQAGAWHTGNPGCGATTHHQRPLIIEGGTAVLRNPGADTIAVGFDYAKQGGSDPCGRWQIDIVNKVTNEIAALVIDTGIRCGKPPVIDTPPAVVSQVSFTPEPEVVLYEEVPTPTLFTVPVDPTPIPEPATLLMVGGAMALATLRQRTRRK